jgi:predicted DNA binding CopG/RHH family protein
MNSKVICNNKEYRRLKKLAEYYDKIDLTEEEDFSKAVFEEAENTLKKVNILIPNNIIEYAKKIGSKTGVGYQNTLKTAMAIGLEQLKSDMRM